MTLRRLEEIVGASIFHRSGSGVSATRAGERLLVHAHSILHTHDQALFPPQRHSMLGYISPMEHEK